MPEEVVVIKKVVRALKYLDWNMVFSPCNFGAYINWREFAALFWAPAESNQNSSQNLIEMMTRLNTSLNIQTWFKWNSNKKHGKFMTVAGALVCALFLAKSEGLGRYINGCPNIQTFRHPPFWLCVDAFTGNEGLLGLIWAIQHREFVHILEK